MDRQSYSKAINPELGPINQSLNSNYGILQTLDSLINILVTSELGILKTRKSDFDLSLQVLTGLNGKDGGFVLRLEVVGSNPCLHFYLGSFLAWLMAA